jgi:MFS family permease
MSLFLQKIKGFTPQQAGTILVAQPLVMTVLSPFAGKLSDRIEPRKLATTGMLISAIGLFMLTFIGPQTPVYLIVAVLIIMGIGFGIFSSPNYDMSGGCLFLKQSWQSPVNGNVRKAERRRKRLVQLLHYKYWL